MKATDITSNHTRKEMNAMAEELGIENPSSFKNKTELAKSMAPIIEKKMEEEAIPEGVVKVKSLLKELRDTEIPTDRFKDKLKDLTDSKKRGAIEEAKNLIDELVDEATYILNIDERLSELDDELESINDNELRGEVQESVEVVIKKAEKGNFDEALKEIDQAIEYTKGYRDRVETKKVELEERVEDAKKRLSELRETAISIDKIKNLFREGLNAKKEDQVDLALEKIQETIDKSIMVQDIFERLKEGKKLLQEIKNKDIAFKSYLDILKTGKKKADEGDYKYSIQLLDDAINDMNQELEDKEELELKRDDVEKKVRHIQRKIEAIENAIKVVKKDLDDILKG